jgi:molybdopterin converting factor small subunit
MIEVTVNYYAAFREQRGLRTETVQTNASTARDLYLQLQADHHLSLDPVLVRVAVNNELSGLDVPIRASDKVVFIPPVAGG